MLCKFCQSEMNADELVCPSCGKRQDEPLEELQEAPQEEAEATQEQTQEEVEATPEQPQAAAPEMKPGIQATPGKIALFVLGCVVLFGVVVALMLHWLNGGVKEQADPTAAPTGTVAATEAIPEETVVYTIPADGNADDATCKGTYTVSDEDAAAANGTVVATIGEYALTNGQLQAYYWSAVVNFLQQYSSYISYFGLDPSVSLDTQPCPLFEEDESRTWQQYFLEVALDDWHRDVALVEESKKAGFTLSEEEQAELDGIPQTMEEAAASAEVGSTEELIQGVAGKGATLQDYIDYLNLNNRAYFYYSQCMDDIQKLEITEAELEAYFAEHEAGYAENGLTKDSGLAMDVRHILLQPENGVADESGYSMTYSDEDWAACEQKAQALLDQWKQGDATEESFAALAEEHSVDGGSNTNGGLYAGLTAETNFVEEFKAWYMDESRKPGDTGLVKTMHGWHIMYFSGSQPQWKATVREDMLNDRANTVIPAAMESYTVTVDYSAIVLGLVDLM